jgi:hypothetical protein
MHRALSWKIDCPWVSSIDFNTDNALPWDSSIDFNTDNALPWAVYKSR